MTLQRLLGVASIVIVGLMSILPMPASQVKPATGQSHHLRPTVQDRNWSLTTLPVGHGDAHVIESSSGQVTVVDAGSTETADVILKFLKARRIDRIHRLIITHPHWDHIGGSMKLIRNVAVDEILRPGLDHQTQLVRRVQTRVEDHGIPVTRLVRGDTVPLGGGVAGTVINPARKRPGSLNQASLAFHFTVGNVRTLMMGDVVNPMERRLLDRGWIPDADVLKVAHHGNSKGTTHRFLRTVNPKIAIIPAPLRKHDPWDRPDQALMKRLRTNDIPIFHTGRHGAITINFDPNGILKVTSKTPWAESG